MSVLESYHLVNTNLQSRAVSSEHFPHVWVYLTLDKVAWYYFTEETGRKDQMSCLQWQFRGSM